MAKRCAKCEKIVYPTEELKCLDKVEIVDLCGYKPAVNVLLLSLPYRRVCLLVTQLTRVYSRYPRNPLFSTLPVHTCDYWGKLGRRRFQGNYASSQRSVPPLAPDDFLSVLDTSEENLVIKCWFYVKNCIFEHMTDIIFLVTAPPPRETPAPTGLLRWRC